MALLILFLTQQMVIVSPKRSGETGVVRIYQVVKKIIEHPTVSSVECVKIVASN